MKLPLVLFEQFTESLEVARGSVDSELSTGLSSSYSLDSAPRDHAPPKKLHQFPAKDVAMELTLMDSELLRGIRPDEIKDGAWTKRDTKVCVGGLGYVYSAASTHKIDTDT